MYSCHCPSCCLHLNCNISLSHLSSCSIPCFVKFRRCLPGCEVLTKFSSCSDAENLIHSFPWNKRRHNGSACAPIHHTLAYRKISFGAWQRCHSSLLTILQINQREDKPRFPDSFAWLQIISQYRIEKAGNSFFKLLTIDAL